MIMWRFGYSLKKSPLPIFDLKNQPVKLQEKKKNEVMTILEGEPIPPPAPGILGFVFSGIS